MLTPYGCFMNSAWYMRVRPAYGNRMKFFPWPCPFSVFSAMNIILSFLPLSDGWFWKTLTSSRNPFPSLMQRISFSCSFYAITEHRNLFCEAQRLVGAWGAFTGVQYAGSDSLYFVFMVISLTSCHGWQMFLIMICEDFETRWKNLVCIFLFKDFL